MFPKYYFLFLTFHLITMLSSVNGRHSPCSASTAVEGRRSEIICHFNENMAFTKTKFDVFKYDSLIMPDLVLTCDWSRTRDDPECVTRPGYDFDPFDLHTEELDPFVLQTTVTITIPYTSLRHAGNYSCQSSPSGLSTASHNCTLNVIGSRNSCTAGRVNEGERSTIVCHFNQDLNVTKGSFAVRKKSPHGVYETVFACNWGKLSGKHVCAPTTGYSLTSDIAHSAAISIQNTGQEHDGVYHCVTVPEHRGVTSEQCWLEVTPKVANTEQTSSMDIKSSSTKSTHFSNTGNRKSIHAPFVLIAASFLFHRGILYKDSLLAN